MSDVYVHLMTVDELLEISNHGGHYELISGELREMSPTNEVHGLITQELAGLIWNFVRINTLGRVYAAETGFMLHSDFDTVLAPDIAYIAKSRIEPAIEKFVAIAPDLAVEVISPGNTAAEMNDKIDLYFRGGTQQVWIVYPKTRTIHVYSAVNRVSILAKDDSLTGEPVLPGFILPLQELFSVLDG